MPILLICSCSNGTSFFNSSGMEGEAVGSRPTRCMCNLPIKKKIQPILSIVVCYPVCWIILFFFNSILLLVIVDLDLKYNVSMICVDYLSKKKGKRESMICLDCHWGHLWFSNLNWWLFFEQKFWFTFCFISCSLLLVHK